MEKFSSFTPEVSKSDTPEVSSEITKQESLGHKLKRLLEAQKRIVMASSIIATSACQGQSNVVEVPHVGDNKILALHFEPTQEWVIKIIKNELKNTIAPELLDEAGIEDEDKDNVLDEVVHCFKMTMSSEGKYHANLAINRTLLRDGEARLFIASEKNIYRLSSDQVALTDEEEQGAVIRGIDRFSEVTGLPVRIVKNKVESNVTLSLLSTKDEKRQKDPSVRGHVTYAYEVEHDKFDSKSTDANVYVDAQENVGQRNNFGFQGGLSSGLTIDLGEEEFMRLGQIAIKKRMQVKTEWATLHELTHLYGHYGHSEDKASYMYPAMEIFLEQAEEKDVDFKVGAENFKLSGVPLGVNTTQALRLARILERHGW